jgi:hypothetical protein
MKRFGEAVCGHSFRADPFNVYMALLNPFAEPVLVYINVAKAGFELRSLLLHKVHGLFIIAINLELVPGFEAQLLEQAAPPNELCSGVGQAEKLGFG